MRLLWRRLRGMLGTAIVWAGAFALVGLGVGAFYWLTGEWIFGFGGTDWLVFGAQAGAITGALSGGAFSLGVMALERRGDFSALTPFRFGILGAVAAGLVTVYLAEWNLVAGLIGAASGLVCASGSVVVARRAVLPPQSTAKPLPRH